jgi:putative DNA primase/helicase
MPVNPEEFKEFDRLLTAGRKNYKPWYFLLEMNNKDPLRTAKGWKHRDSQLSFKHAYRHMMCGMNIGVAGTEHDMLVIIDIDDETNVPDKTIKPTLSSRSRSRIGTHHFYFATGKDAKVNIPSDELGEIRSFNQYVVAPGSFVPCSDEELSKVPSHDIENVGKYSLERRTLAQDISYHEFPFAFREQIRIKKQKQAEKEVLRSKRSTPKPSTTQPKSMLYSLTITDIVGNHPDRERFPSLFHGSKTGSNTSISENKIHCYRHNVSLTPLRALAVLAEIDTCMNAGVGHAHSNAGDSTIDLNDGRTIFELWSYAKQIGILSADDVIPAVALTWFTVANGICQQEDLIDGWKIPTDAYMKAKDTLYGIGIMKRPARQMCCHASPNPECGRKV